MTEFDGKLRRLLLDMFASMEAANGVGLAANQIGVDARIFVIDCPDADEEDVVGYVINPTLTLPPPVGDEPAELITDEGCLSVPGPYADLPRAYRARVDGVDLQGNPVTIETTGMAARCLQHEVDHLNGTVYVDLLPEAQRDRLLAEAAGPGGDPAAHEPAGPFDLDGTLVDPSPGIHASVRVAVAALALPDPTPAQLRAMVGPPLQEGFALGVRAARARTSTGLRRLPRSPTPRADFQPRRYPGIPQLLARRGPTARRSPSPPASPNRSPSAILEHVGLLGHFSSVHGATLDGTVRHKDQVVGAALAEHPEGPRSRSRRRPCTGRPRRRGARSAVRRRRLGSRRGRRARERPARQLIAATPGGRRPRAGEACLAFPTGADVWERFNVRGT